MAYTLEQYNVLCESIAQGILKVEYSDKKVEYRSLAEMNQIKAQMEKQLFQTNSSDRRIFADFNKGT